MRNVCKNVRNIETKKSPCFWFPKLRGFFRRKYGPRFCTIWRYILNIRSIFYPGFPTKLWSNGGNVSGNRFNGDNFEKITVEQGLKNGDQQNERIISDIVCSGGLVIKHVVKNVFNFVENYRSEFHRRKIFVLSQV